MARLLSLLALTSLAVLASAAGAPGDAANHPVARAFGNHHNVAKRHGELASSGRKRDVSKRCAAKSSSSSAVVHAAATSAASATSTTKEVVATTTSTKKAETTTTKAAETTTKKASATTSTSKAVATSSASSSSSSDSGCSGKIGLAWSNHEADLIPDFTNSNVCWLYDWEESLQYGMTDNGLNYIPMLWGWKNADSFKSKVVAGYAKYAAFLNEPDISSQSNIAASEGATMWKTYMLPLKSQGYKVISAAPATGPTWLQNMRSACSDQGIDCSWDYTAAHIYTTSFDSFKTVATSYHVADFDWAPVMITEYACEDYSGNNDQASTDEIWTFMENTKSWLESQDWITAYFYFAPMTSSELESNSLNGLNAMISSDGSTLTDLGKYYIS